MLPIISALLPTIGKVIDRAVPDKDKAQELKHDIQTQLIDLNTAELQAAQKVITAEASGHSWLQRNWRPLLMLVIVAIVFNNYVLFPYVELFGGKATILELPDKLFNLMSIGVGGYIVGRSGEKIADKLKR